LLDLTPPGFKLLGLKGAAAAKVAAAVCLLGMVFIPQ
jgi:hypothetical protein